MNRNACACAAGLALAVIHGAAAEVTAPTFNPGKDLVSLHYDHAADPDDGHSAAADRTILESLYGRGWVTKHVVVVSGAYGKNGNRFVEKSDGVMDAVWNPCGGWLDGHAKRKETIGEMTRRWTETLKAGGDVWVKEGGQSDLSAAVVRGIRATHLAGVDTRKHVHVVQHSVWNEKNTTDADLEYVKLNTDYVKIKDANSYLRRQGGDAEFAKVAATHPVFGPSWQAAFSYYNPHKCLDFSDTGELMHILGLGRMSIDAFRQRFLEGGQ